MIDFWVLALLAAQASSTASAEAEYEAFFLGTFAPQRECLDRERAVSLSRDIILEGDRACDIVGISRSDDTLVVRTQNCSRNGQRVEDVAYRLELLSETAIRLSSGERRSMLWRCDGL